MTSSAEEDTLRCRTTAFGQPHVQSFWSDQFSPPSTSHCSLVHTFGVDASANLCKTPPRSPAYSYSIPLQSLPEDIEYKFLAPSDVEYAYEFPPSSIADYHPHHAGSDGGGVGHLSAACATDSALQAALPPLASLSVGDYTQSQRAPKFQAVDPELLKEFWGATEQATLCQDAGRLPHTLGALAPPDAQAIAGAPSYIACSSVTDCNGDRMTYNTRAHSSDLADHSSCSYPQHHTSFEQAALLQAGTGVPARPRAVPLRAGPRARRSFEYTHSSHTTSSFSPGPHPFSQVSPGVTTLASSLQYASVPLLSSSSSRLLKSTSAADLVAGGEGRVRGGSGGSARLLSKSDQRVRGGRASEGGSSACGSVPLSASCDMFDRMLLQQLQSESLMAANSLESSLPQQRAMQRSYSAATHSLHARAMQRSYSSISCGTTCSDKIKGGTGKMEGRVRGGLPLRVALQAGKVQASSPISAREYHPADANKHHFTSAFMHRAASVPLACFSLMQDNSSDSLSSHVLAQLDNSLSRATTLEQTLDGICAIELPLSHSGQIRAFKVRPGCGDGTNGSSCGDLFHYSSTSSSTLLEMADQAVLLHQSERDNLIERSSLPRSFSVPGSANGDGSTLGDGGGSGNGMLSLSLSPGRLQPAFGSFSLPSGRGLGLPLLPSSPPALFTLSQAPFPISADEVRNGIRGLDGALEGMAAKEVCQLRGGAEVQTM